MSGCIVGSIVTCKRPMCGNTFARKDGLHVYCSKLCRDVDRKDIQNARRRERHQESAT